MRLRGTRRSQPSTPPASPPVDRQRQLRGVPHLHPVVETLADPKHGFVLSWVAASPARKGFLGRLFPAPARRRRLVLDQVGRRTIELIDGGRSIGEIAAALAVEFAMERATTEEATILFFGRLLAKNIVAIVDPQA